MKRIILTFCLIALAGIQLANGKDFTYRVKAGFNIGGTAPLPLPAEIRKIEGFNPKMNLAIGAEVIRNFNPKWGLMTGLRFETKSMTTKARVKSYKMSIDISDGDETGSASGYFTGGVKTKVRNEYLTVPIAAVYNVSPKVELNAGVFMSVKLSGEFSGEAYDGILRDQTPTGEKIGITSATYDLEKDIRNFNWGGQVGVHWMAYKQFSVYGDFTMAANSIFAKNNPTVPFPMYNIYMNIGFGYTF